MLGTSDEKLGMTCNWKKKQSYVGEGQDWYNRRNKDYTFSDKWQHKRNL